MKHANPTRPGRPARLALRLPLLALLALFLGSGSASAGLAPLPGIAAVVVGDTPWVLHRTQDEITVFGEEIDPDLSDTERRYRGRLRGGPLAPVMTRDGILFRFHSKSARSVSVVGQFNDWDEDATPLKRSRNDVWRAQVELDSGSWTYLYVVDGEWVEDPDNPILFPAEDTDGESLGEASFVKVQRDEVVIPRSAGYREGEGTLSMTYDRVDQIAVKSGLSYSNRAELHPDLSLEGGYSFGRERWLYDVDMAQPLFGSEILDLGATAYRRTDTPDRHRMGDLENSLATFFFREDWRDYHEAEGVAVRAQAYLAWWTDLAISWKDEDHRAVEKTTNWGLFGGEKRMRENPAVDEGKLRALKAAWTLDTRNSNENATSGFYVTGSWEQAGGELGGDFEFKRAIADVRRYMKLSPGHHLAVRITGGTIEEAQRGGESGKLTGFEAIPVQERFYLGGVGTMRATQFKSIPGDRMLLGNAEVRVDVSDDFQVAIFTDVGDAWVAAERDPRLHTDAGVGFQDADGSFRVNFAKKLDRGDDDSIFVTARIRQMF